MRLDQLRLFLAAAECGSISQAARRARLAQPAFSAHVKALEQSLGVSLFERSTRGVHLTVAGERLREKAQALLRHVEYLRQEVVAPEKELVGDVRIVLAGSVTQLLAGRIFHDVYRAYPRIRLSILDLLRVAGEDLVNSRLVDFGLLPNAATLKSASTEPILSQDLYLVGRDLPSDATNEVPFRALHRYPLVMGGRRNQLRLDLENTAAQKGFRINVVSEQDSLSVYRSIILNGPFFTVVPYSAYETDIENGALCAARIVSPRVERSLSFVWHQHSELSASARAVMDIVRKRISQMTLNGELRGRLLSKEAN
jgi:LysR family nitrogen assimilation transcriptional regulator